MHFPATSASCNESAARVRKQVERECAPRQFDTDSKDGKRNHDPGQLERDLVRVVTCFHGCVRTSALHRRG